jgi:hypothetical protein
MGMFGIKQIADFLTAPEGFPSRGFMVPTVRGSFLI